jgi:hypothetical protein
MPDKQTEPIPRRKTLLVDKYIQLEFIAIVVITFLIMMVLTVLNFTSFLYTILPQASIVAGKDRIIIYIVSTVLIIGVAAVFVLIYSHRIIGPIPRLQREITDMVESGDYHLFVVRKKDKLKNFIESINLLIKELNERKPK